jgi:hypothetical protein
VKGSKYKLVNGFTNKDLDKELPVKTIAGLIELLKFLPPDLPIGRRETDACEVMWYNVGMQDEHLSLDMVEDVEDM